MRHAVRSNFAHGVDFIKLYGSGSMMAKGSVPGIPIMDEDEILEAVRIAKQKGTYCAIHCHGTEAIDTALRCGVATIEHASFIGEESLERIAGSPNCGIVPTLSITKAILNADPNTEYGKHVIKKVQPLVDKIKVCLGRAYDRGDILIGWGTDVAMSAYLADPGLEFRVRRELLGWGSLELLRQATINSAKLLRIDSEVGTIKVGKCADVILVNGDPVADISVMYEPAARVFRAGRLYE